MNNQDNDPNKDLKSKIGNLQNFHGTKNTKNKDIIQKIVQMNNAFVSKQTTIDQKKPIDNQIIIIPNILVFHDFVANEEYELEVQILNNTTSKKKIKVLPPESKNFKITTGEIPFVAAGLSMKVIVRFTSKSNEQCQDILKIVADDLIYEAQLSAFPPSPYILFEPLLNFNYVVLETSVKKQIILKNVGSKEASVEFKIPDDSPLRLEETIITVPSKGESKVSIEFYSNKLGVHSLMINLEVAGQCLLNNIINVSAVVVNNAVYLLDESGNEISDLHFGQTVVGEQFSKKLLLVNNSPSKTNFKVQMIKGLHADIVDQEHIQTPMEAGIEQNERVIFVSPQQGELKEYETQEIRVTFKSPVLEGDNGWVNNYALCKSETIPDNRIFEYTALFQTDKISSVCEKGPLQKSLLISAEASLPKIILRPQHLEFGALYVGQQLSYKVELQNNLGKEIQIKPPFESFIHSEPRQFTLAAGETKEVKITFKPKNLGIFSKTLHFTLNKDFKLRFAIQGTAIMPVRGLSLPHQNSNLKPKTADNSITENNKQSKTKSSNLKLPKLSEPTSKLLESFNNQIQLNKINLNSCHEKEPDNLPSPRPVVSQRPLTLFVIKPLKNHEPYSLKTIGIKFIPDPRMAFKEFPSISRDHETSKQISEKLNGEKLTKIQVGPTELVFSKLFVNSKSSLYFQIRNELRTAIQARLIPDEDVQELIDTSKKAQIIPSGKTAGFKVIVTAIQAKSLREKIGYIINEANTFYFSVAAEIIPVDLELSRQTINFKFREESLDMTAIEKITISNQGNSPAKFKFVKSENSPFRILSECTEVAQGGNLELEVEYAPQTSKDEEALQLEIENGVTKFIKCLGQVSEVRMEAIGINLNIGTISVGQRKQTNFQFKNGHNKNYLVFRLDEKSLPEGAEIRPKAGKICSEEIQKFELDFCSLKRSDLKSHEIIFFIRGAKPVKVTLTVSTIVPKVEIEQKDFDFDRVTFGNKVSLPLTIANRSTIQAELHLDLSSKNKGSENFECLDIETVGRLPTDSIILEQRECAIDTNDNNQQVTERRVESKENRLFVFFIKPNRVLEFKLTFAPIKPALYEFELPFFIPGQERNKSLFRKVRCFGTSPKFLMEPLSGFIEFPKKIILAEDTVIPDYRVLLISNPSLEDSLYWRLDNSVLESQNIFSINPLSGIVDPQVSASLKISFKPNKPQIFELSVPLFLSDEPNPYSEIKIKGEGAYPRLLFEVEEVIIQPVPLGHKGSATIIITNDGYDSSLITVRKPDALSCLTVESSDWRIGPKNNILSVEISFVTRQPLSFTAKIEFEDEQKRSFPLLVSGASDNSILTTYAYFGLINKHPFKYDSKLGPVPVYTEEEQADDKSEKASSHSGISNEDSINEINFYKQVGISLQNWLTEYGLSPVQNYPEDLVNNYGGLIFDLLDLLIKGAPSRPDVEALPKRTDRIKAIITEYTKLLNFLKEHNAMLNTVRPHFLLSYKDLLAYYRANQNSYVHQKYY